MGRAGLTAVFGMGTGVTPPVWSPEKWPAGIEAPPATEFRGGRTRSAQPSFTDEWGLLHDILSKKPYGMAHRPIDLLGMASWLGS
jgi:hypothetical protein